jgi:integrase
MSSFRTEIKESLKEARPNLGDSSLATYTSLVSSMSKKADIDTMDKLRKIKEKEVFKIVDEMSNKSSQKTLLSAIFLITQKKEFHNRMIEYAKEVNQTYHKQEISDSRKDSYITFDAVKDRYDLAAKNLHDSPSPNNYIEFLICALMSGATPGLHPRRLEWATVKHKNFDTTTDNYMHQNNFIFNNYKTVKTYGRQKVFIPKELRPIIKRWLKINTASDYILTTKMGKQMTATGLSSKIGSIYGDGKIGVDILRSIYISHIYASGPAPSMEEAERIATAMGHSVLMQMQYRKMDAPASSP